MLVCEQVRLRYLPGRQHHSAVCYSKLTYAYIPSHSHIKL